MTPFERHEVHSLGSGRVSSQKRIVGNYKESGGLLNCTIYVSFHKAHSNFISISNHGFLFNSDMRLKLLKSIYLLCTLDQMVHKRTL